MRGMLDGERPTASGRYTTDGRAQPARARPGAPAHPHRRQRAARSRCAWWPSTPNACNIGGAAADLAEKDAALVAHCEAIGRDEKTIERTVGMGTPFIRDSREEAFTVMADVFADNGDAKTWTGMPIGTVEDVVEHCKPFLDQGYRHLIFGFPAPYDEETLARLATRGPPAARSLPVRLTPTARSD